jgi:hypothetical protein
LEAVLSLLAGPDAATQRLVTAELAFRPGQIEQVTESDLETVKAVLASGDLAERAIEYLLRAMTPHVDRLGGDWLADECRHLLESHGVELDLASFVPSLLVVALRTLAVTGNDEDAGLALGHLSSNNPEVGISALEAAAALDPKLTRSTVAAVVDQDTMHPDTRRAIQVFLDARG